MNTKVQEIMSKVILADKTVHIKLLGDSITHGMGGEGFLQSGAPIVEDFKRNPDGYCWAKLFKDFMEAQYNCTVTNNACSGVTIEFLLEHFDTLVSEEDDIIICAIGTNNRNASYDLGKKPDKQEFLKQFRDKIVLLNDKIKAAGKKVIFIANIPCVKKNDYALFNDEQRFWRVINLKDVQDAYVSASYMCGFPLICLYSLFLKTCKDRGLDYETLFDDGLHPNNAGYDLMFELILRELGLAEIPD